MDEIIKFENVTFKYSSSNHDILKNISLEIKEGEMIAILGHNGSGKSTLAKHMNGILVPTSGKVTVCGYDTSDENNIINIRRNVGMVFQNPDNQIVSNVVEDDVAFAPENLGVDPPEIRQRVDIALKEVGMYEYRKHAPHMLSGGQKQRIAIAGVIAMQPKVIVLDEATAMLDPKGRADVLSTVTDLCRKKGMTVVFITHHMDECVNADRMYVVSNGILAASGTPKEVFSKVEMMKAEGLSVPETTRILYDLNLPLSSLSMEDTAKEISKWLN